MKTLSLFFLLAFCAATVWAQPLPDPFSVLIADSGTSFSGARVTMRDSATADIFYVETGGSFDNHLFHAVVSFPEELITSGPEEIPAFNRWDLTFGDVASRGNDGWITLLYGITHENTCTVDSNRTWLAWGNDTLVNSALLDTGRMPFVYPHNGDHTNSSFSLCSRHGGGWLASWINEGVGNIGPWSEPSCTARVVTFDENLAKIADQFFGREAAVFGPYWVRAVSWSADSVLALLWGDFVPYMNWVPRSGEPPYPFPVSCSFYPYDFRRTRGGRLLACAEGSSILEIQPSGTCDSVGSIGLADYPVFIAWHPDFGYVFLKNFPHVIMLARVDTSGQAVQPPGVFYDGGSNCNIAFSSATIAPNGRVVVLWGEQQQTDTACITLKTAWVDWATYLSTSDRDFIPHPSSLGLASFPNPFNATTQLSFDLPRSGKVALQVFDLLGREVARLIDETREAGTHRISWNANSQPSGLYFARLTTPDGIRTIKLCLTK